MDKVWGEVLLIWALVGPVHRAMLSSLGLMSVTQEEAGRCDGYTAAMAVNTCDTTLSGSQHSLMLSIFATEGK